MEKIKLMNDGYMPTTSGIIFNLMDPDPDHINIDDIAHGLSNNCRWNGQTQRFYSVAEHCTKCYWHYLWTCRRAKEFPQNINKKTALAILLHDAEEAYWSDWITPIKNLLPDSKAKMDELRIMICHKFNIHPDDSTWGDFVTSIKNVLPDLRAKMDDLRMMIWKKFDVYPNDSTAILVHKVDQHILMWEYQNIVLNDYEETQTPAEAKKMFLILFNKLNKQYAG